MTPATTIASSARLLRGLDTAALAVAIFMVEAERVTPSTIAVSDDWADHERTVRCYQMHRSQHVRANATA